MDIVYEKDAFFGISESITGMLILHSMAYTNIADSPLNYSAECSVPLDTVETHLSG